GLAHGAGLLGPVQHGDLHAGGGDGVHKVRYGEGAVQVHLHHAHFPAFPVQIVHRVLHRLAGGAHHHDDLFRVRGAVVVEQLVVPARQLVDLIHIVLDHAGDRGDLLVGALPALEEHVRVHRRAPGGGVLRVQAIPAEGLELVIVHQLGEIIVIQGFDPLHLVRRAEAVEAVHEGVPAADGGQMGHRAQVHSLLGGGGHQHAEAGHPAGHHVRVIAEDGQGVGADGPAGDVEHAGQELAADLVHGRNHQQQALGCRVGGGQGAPACREPWQVPA
ncbi:Inner membrane protein ypdA, partial [Dysosmobacter welbionis]